MDKRITYIVAFIIFICATLYTTLIAWAIGYTQASFTNLGVIISLIPAIAMYIGTVWMLIIAYKE